MDIELIPFGKKNAISRGMLRSYTGYDDRRVRREIERLRREGEIIISASDGGYFRPTRSEEDLAEVRGYILENRAKARETLSMLTPIVRFLNEN